MGILKIESSEASSKCISSSTYNIQNDRNSSCLGRSHRSRKRTTTNIDAALTLRGHRMRQHGLQLDANWAKLLLLGDRQFYYGTGERAMCNEGRNPERRKRCQPTRHVVPGTTVLDKRHS